VNLDTPSRPVPTPGLPPLAEEEARSRALRVMKGRATGLLVGVTAVFVVLTVLDDGAAGYGYARAAAEASMVGGLADWFAVTALFRHPLGLPIPHTAVIAERKEQFGRTLGDFVQQNFLNADVLAERVGGAGVVRRVTDWLADPAHAEKVAGHAAGVAVALADVVRDEDVHGLIEQEIRRAVEAVPVAPLAGRALRVMIAEGRDRELVDAALPAFRGVLDEHRLALRDRFAQESPWWLPDRAEGRIFDRLFERQKDLLYDVEDDPDHELRARLREWLNLLVVRLETSPDMRARGERLKHALLEHPELRRWSSSLWGDVKAALRRQADDPASDLRLALGRAVVAGADRVRDDPALEAKGEELLEKGVRRLAEQFHDEVAGLVGATIARWDGNETSRKLELLLGRDLQYIRINGTVVGGFAGLVIHAAVQTLG